MGQHEDYDRWVRMPAHVAVDQLAVYVGPTIQRPCDEYPLLHQGQQVRVQYVSLLADGRTRLVAVKYQPFEQLPTAVDRHTTIHDVPIEDLRTMV